MTRRRALRSRGLATGIDARCGAFARDDVAILAMSLRSGANAGPERDASRSAP